MTSDLSLGWHRLKGRTVHRIEDGQGLQVTCLGGALWITQAGDLRDIVLEPGQAFVLDRQGTALLFAFGETTLLLSEPDPARLEGPGLQEAA